MSTTVFYRRGELCDRTRPPEGLPFRVLAAMTASGKFGRSSRGAILFEPEPGNFIPLTRAPEIIGVLRDTGAIQWAGDPVPDSEWQFIAMSVNDFRYKLPPVPESRYAPARINTTTARTVLVRK